MTLIICDRIDCMYNYQRPDKKHGCKCDAIGIGVDMKCDSYMDVPEVIKESTVEADADKLCPGGGKC